MNTNEPVYQSRWGHHPCSHDLYLKLKCLHKWYWQTIYDFHRWHHWWRKDPTHRVGPEPNYCAFFVQDQPWYKPVTKHGQPACKVYPRTVLDLNIPALYQQARTPSLELVPAFDVAVQAHIVNLYKAIKPYFEGGPGEM